MLLTTFNKYKHPTSYEDVSAIRYQRLQNLAWMFFQQLFILTSKPPFTTQWQQCDQTWKLKHLFPFRTELVAENAIFGTQQAVWKKDSEVSQFFKKIFGLSLLPPAEVCDCFALEFLSNLPNKRVEQFCDCLLENYIEIDSTFLLLFGPKYCIIIEGHKRVWVILCPLQCSILQCAS